MLYIRPEPEKVLRLQIFGATEIVFQQIPMRVDRFLEPPEPIVLNYTLNPGMPPPDKAVAFDVEIKVDDTNLKTRMSHVVLSMAPESAKELSKIDEEVCPNAGTLCTEGLHHCMTDLSARPRAQQLAPQALVPACVRGQPPGVHSDVARVTVARFGEHPRQRSK